MDIGDMKNIIVLKNLPSNIIEEAIVVFKDNKKTKIKESSKNLENEEEKIGKEYIVKEAEMIVSNYITDIEKQKQQNSKNIKNIAKKYKRLKYITTFLVVILTGIIFFLF